MGASCSGQPWRGTQGWSLCCSSPASCDAAVTVAQAAVTPAGLGLGLGLGALALEQHQGRRYLILGLATRGCPWSCAPNPLSSFSLSVIFLWFVIVQPSSSVISQEFFSPSPSRPSSSLDNLLFQVCPKLGKGGSAWDPQSPLWGGGCGTW